MIESVKKKKKNCSPSHGSVDSDDKICSLPDSLIHHILSFLTMRDVIRTCVLSSRWRYLWTSVPVLNFFYPYTGTFIGLSLMRYEAQKIRRFRLHLWRNVDACHIDSWIHFATRHDVEELDIQFPYNSAEPGNRNRYRIPQCLFDCGALRLLRLSYSNPSLFKSFSFRSLTTLDLYCRKLTDLDTSGCPCLENLIIGAYNNSLKLYAPNQKLRYLKIEDRGVDGNCGLTLYAPHLLYVEMTCYLRRIFEFKNLSFIKSANLDFFDTRMFDSDSTQSLVELLKYLTNAKTLKLSSVCIKCLARGDQNNLKMPPRSATCLELGSNLTKSELPGITSLLKSCHCLETLIINIHFDAFDPSFPGSEIESWELLEHALSADLQIKTVVMHNFMGSEIDRLRRRPKPIFNMNKFQGNWLAEIKLVKLLLNRCKALDKMIIRTIKMPFPLLKSELLLGLTKKLLEFPRASVTAKIYIT